MFENTSIMRILQHQHSNTGTSCVEQATVSQTLSHTFRLNVTGLGLSDSDTAKLKVEGTAVCVGSATLDFTYRSYDALVLDEIGGVEADGSASIEFMKCFPDYVSWDAVSNAADYDGVQGRLTRFPSFQHAYTHKNSRENF